jgi:Cro/C1-type HTH DNA-binding domain
MTRRHISYQWKLREIMATRGLFTTTHLAPLLAERGITLSASQIHRLVTGTPERLSLPEHHPTTRWWLDPAARGRAATNTITALWTTQ